MFPQEWEWGLGVVLGVAMAHILCRDMDEHVATVREMGGGEVITGASARRRNGPRFVMMHG
jgi:hypothetical protein